MLIQRRVLSIPVFSNEVEGLESTISERSCGEWEMKSLLRGSASSIARQAGTV